MVRGGCVVAVYGGCVVAAIAVLVVVIANPYLYSLTPEKAWVACALLRTECLADLSQRVPSHAAAAASTRFSLFFSCLLVFHIYPWPLHISTTRCPLLSVRLLSLPMYYKRRPLICFATPLFCLHRPRRRAADTPDPRVRRLGRPLPQELPRAGGGGLPSVRGRPAWLRGKRQAQGCRGKMEGVCSGVKCFCLLRESRTKRHSRFVLLKHCTPPL